MAYEIPGAIWLFDAGRDGQASVEVRAARRALARPREPSGPPGVLIVGGPGIRPGQFENASVYDVAPTLLRLMDLPVAEDMQGKPLEIGLPGSVLSHEPVRVATHGAAAESLSPEQVSKEELDRLKEQLRALGYVN